jgi:hypothetical protein
MTTRLHNDAEVRVYLEKEHPDWLAQNGLFTLKKLNPKPARELAEVQEPEAMTNRQIKDIVPKAWAARRSTALRAAQTS